MFSEIFSLLGCIIFLFAPACFGALFFNERPERCFLPALIINSIIFYILAIFNASYSGFPYLYAANLLLLIPIFLRIRKNPAEAKKLATPGIMALLSASLATFFVTRNMQFASWDTISHWGKVTKFLIEEGKLCCQYPRSIVMHASYPPGSSVTAAMINSCFSRSIFTEGFFYFAHLIMDFGALIWILSFFSPNQKKTGLLALLVTALVLPALAALDCFSYGYTDSTLLLTMAITFYQLIRMDEFKKREIFSFALLTSWLFMIRDAGWGYAIGLLVLFAIILITKRKKAFYESDGRVSPGKIALTALAFILPAALKISWKLLLKYYDTSMRFNRPNNLPELFASAESQGWDILKRFTTQFCCDYLIYYLAALALGILIIKKCRQQDIIRQTKITLIYFSAGLVIFTISLFTLYCREFYMLNFFPSFDRYIFSYLMIPVMVMLLIVTDLFSRHLKHSNSDYLFTAANMIILPAVLVKILLVPGDEVPAYSRWRNECARICRYDQILQHRENSFMIICTSGNGFKSFAMSYLYPYSFVYSKRWDPVTDNSKARRNYTEETTVEQLKAEFQRVRYVYFDDPREDFIQDFASVFAPGVNVELSAICGKLFKVTPAGLVPVDNPGELQ